MMLTAQDTFPRHLLLISVLIEVALVILYFTTASVSEQSGVIYKLFNLDSEINIPSVLSALQLAAVGLVFLAMTIKLKDLDDIPPMFTLVIGLGFLFLSFDELFSVHERITSTLKHIAPLPRFKGEHGIWIVPYALIGLVLFALMFRNFLSVWRHYKRESLIIIKGAALFVLGGMGLEILSYQLVREQPYPWYVYATEVAMEEFLEMLGVSIILYGSLLLYQARELTVRNRQPFFENIELLGE